MSPPRGRVTFPSRRSPSKQERAAVSLLTLSPLALVHKTCLDKMRQSRADRKCCPAATRALRLPFVSLHPLRAAADATLLNNARRFPRSSISHSTCSSPSLIPMSPLLPPALAHADALSSSPARTGRSASTTSYAAQDEFLCPISFVTETTRRSVLNCFRNIVFC